MTSGEAATLQDLSVLLFVSSCVVVLVVFLGGRGGSEQPPVGMNLFFMKRTRTEKRDLLTILPPPKGAEGQNLKKVLFGMTLSTGVVHGKKLAGSGDSWAEPTTPAGICGDICRQLPPWVEQGNVRRCASLEKYFY